MQQLRIEVIDRTYAAILAAKTPAERVEMMVAANRTTRIVLRFELLLLHPDWTDEQRQVEFLQRMMGPEIDQYLASRG